MILRRIREAFQLSEDAGRERAKPRILICGGCILGDGQEMLVFVTVADHHTATEISTAFIAENGM